MSLPTQHHVEYLKRRTQGLGGCHSSHVLCWSIPTACRFLLQFVCSWLLPDRRTMTSDFWIPNTQNNAPDWDTPLDLCSLHALPMKEPCQEGHTPCRFIRDDDTANEVSMFANHVYHQLSVLIGSRHFPKFANSSQRGGES